MKRKTRFPLVLAMAATALCVVRAPLRASDADDQIVATFKATYVYRTYLKDDAVKAEVSDGVVTLTGTVADEFHKTLAQEAVASLPGVTRVNNELAIGETIAAANEDARIARKVNLTLQFHRRVLASGTAAGVKDGVVTLRGEASSVAQKDLTSEYIADLDGVKAVRNEMTVATLPEPRPQMMGETLDDAFINAEVVTSLMTHRSTHAAMTRVATHHGEVTLTGITKNAAQEALIVKLVKDINGVTSVKNQMTVEP